MVICDRIMKKNNRMCNRPTPGLPTFESDSDYDCFHERLFLNKSISVTNAHYHIFLKNFYIKMVFM